MVVAVVVTCTVTPPGRRPCRRDKTRAANKSRHCCPKGPKRSHVPWPRDERRRPPPVVVAVVGPYCDQHNSLDSKKPGVPKDDVGDGVGGGGGNVRDRLAINCHSD